MLTWKCTYCRKRLSIPQPIKEPTDRVFLCKSAAILWGIPPHFYLLLSESDLFIQCQAVPEFMAGRVVFLHPVLVPLVRSFSGRLARVVKRKLLSSITVGIYLHSLTSAALVKFYSTWINQTFIPVQGLSTEKNSLTQFVLFLPLPAGSSASEPQKQSGFWRWRLKNRSFFSQLAAPQPLLFKWSSGNNDHSPSNTARWTFYSRQVLPTSADLLRFICLFVITVNLPQGLWPGDTNTIDSCVDDLKSK